MGVSTIFYSGVGAYAVQAFLHSVVAALVAGRALKAWNVRDPVVRQRFRLLIILLPVLSFPLYQAVNPGRGSALFRLDALFDSTRWLSLDFRGMVPASAILAFLFAATALVFLFQELFPVLRNAFGSSAGDLECAPFNAGPFLERAAQALKIRTPGIMLIEDDDPALFSTTGREPVIYLTSGLLRALTPQERDAALAHELAHIARSRRPVLILAFLFRMVMFFNPVVLLTFRAAVRDEEKICDDVSVSLTGNPGALVSALNVFRTAHDGHPDPAAGPRSPLGGSLEDYGMNAQLGGRIAHLQSPAGRGAGPPAVPLLASFCAIVVVNYYIV